MTKSLDLGCGSSPRNPFSATDVFGVDLDDNPRKNIKKADLSVERIPFASDSFDYVTAYDFIEHVPRVIYLPHRRNPFVELMNEVCRVLKTGGTFLSLTPAYPHAPAFQDPTHVNIITAETFPLYFDDTNVWAGMYGFCGALKIISQEWRGAHLLTIAQKVPMAARVAHWHLENAWKLGERATGHGASDPAGDAGKLWKDVFESSLWVDRERTLALADGPARDVYLRSPYGLRYRADQKDWVVFRHTEINFGSLPAAEDFSAAFTALFNATVERMTSGFMAEAEADLRRILALDPSLWQAYHFLARTIDRDPAQLDEAAGWQRRATALNPALSTNWWSLSDILNRAGRWAEAADALDQFLHLQPGNAQAEFRRRVSVCAAADAPVAACNADKIMLLDKQVLEDWRAGGDIDELKVPDVSANMLDAAYEYDEIDGGEWSAIISAPPDPNDRRLLNITGASLARAGYFEGGSLRWHFDIVLRANGNGVLSYGTPGSMVNSLFSNTYVDATQSRIFLDVTKAKVIPVPEGAPILVLDNVYNYGHWMLDELPRLRLLQQAGVLAACKIHAVHLSSWQRQTIADLGLTDQLLAVPTPEETSEYLHYYSLNTLLLSGRPTMPERADFMRRAFLLKASDIGGAFEKVFISRRNQKSTRMRNEAKVAEFLQERGFTIVAPEELPLHDQIAIYSKAKILISATGSAYANLVFASPGATYLELASRRVATVMKGNFYHYTMFAPLGIRHVILVSDNLDKVGVESWPVADSYEVDLAQLEQALARL